MLNYNLHSNLKNQKGDKQHMLELVWTEKVVLEKQQFSGISVKGCLGVT